MREGKADVADIDMSADSDLDESDSSEEEEQEVDFDADGINKPVSRLKKLTKNQRNQKKERAGRNKAQNQAAHERKMAKQYDRIQLYINEDIRENKFSKVKIEKAIAEYEAEMKQQEESGYVSKAIKVGRKAYKQRKTEFQMEDELAGSLREVKSVGKDDFLRDRFDSVYRTNKLDKPDNEHEAEKKRKDRSAYKFK